MTIKHRDFTLIRGGRYDESVPKKLDAPTPPMSSASAGLYDHVNVTACLRQLRDEQDAERRKP